MSLLYNFVLLVSAAFLLPYYLLRGLRHGKSRRGIRERLGYYDPDVLAALQAQPFVWIHAVSVGETRAALPLIKRLKKDYPDYRILLTNVTETGRAIAADNSNIDYCLFFPFDFSWAVRRVLTQLRPALILLVETEIWPNFTRQAETLGIPLMLVNGRLSDRSYPRYRRLRLLLKPLLQGFTAFCMQSQQDADRIMSLGGDAARVENTGNLKFDYEHRVVDDQRLQLLRNRYGLCAENTVLVAGSTHDGEEKILLDSYRQITPRIKKQPVLVLIPRHPERRREVEATLKKSHIDYRLRSQMAAGDDCLRPGQVLLVDTLGEVMDLYALADLVFVGGSLVPVGGHNLLEAALLAKPVLFGPHVHNFKSISTKLMRAGAGVKVQNQQELEQQTVLLLNDSARARAMGEAGQALIVENAGATERTMRHIRKVLG